MLGNTTTCVNLKGQFYIFCSKCPISKNPQALSPSTSLHGSTSLLDKEKEGQDGYIPQNTLISLRYSLTVVKTLKLRRKLGFYQEYS